MTMTRIIFRGEVLSRRTADMIIYAENHFLGGRKLDIIQGSYNRGGVSASAGTHDGGGAVDVWLTLDWAARVEIALRKVGFAAWHRTPNEGNWGHHVHAIAIGDPELSSGAKKQVTAYYNHRNGLVSNAYDSSWRPNPIPVWGKTFPPKPVVVETPDKLGWPGPTPTRLFQALMRAYWQHERYGYYPDDFSTVERQYITKYKRSMEILAEKKGIQVDPRWSLYAHTRAFQRAYGLTVDGEPGPVTCVKLASLAGYRYVSLTQTPMSAIV